MYKQQASNIRKGMMILPAGPKISVERLLLAFVTQLLFWRSRVWLRKHGGSEIYRADRTYGGFTFAFAFAFVVRV